MILSDAGRYEILYDKKAGEYEPAQVGGIRTKTIRSGEMLEVECYPLTRIGDRARDAAQVRRKQRACQEALNRRNAEKRIYRLINVNFTREDYVVTLTYDYGRVDRLHMSYREALEAWDREKLPVDESDARRDWNNFLKRVKNRIRRAGFDPLELKHLYVWESTHERRDETMPLYPHYHIHAVIHAPGLSMEEVEAAWPNGWVKINRLSVKRAANLASYMTKSLKVEQIDAEGRRVRRWGHSKNLKGPTVTVSDRKISRRRAEIVARDVMSYGVQIMEQIYPGYRCEEEPTVRFSDYVAGAYIYARLRARPKAGPQLRGGAADAHAANRRQEPPISQRMRKKE